MSLRMTDTIPSRTSGCCPPTPAAKQTGCEASCGSTRQRVDWMLWGSAILVAGGYVWHLAFGAHAGPVDHFAAGTFELMNTMWWGILLGILFVGLLDRVPRDMVIAALSGEHKFTGILRATAAGVAFDLCSHGILMVGMKLYERGATIGQTVAFLLASPWNSISLTVILIALIGWWYTLLFILLSAVIGIVTGLVFDALVERGKLPANPARMTDGPRPSFREAWAKFRAETRFSRADIGPMLRAGLSGSRMVLRWLLFGIVLASAVRAFVPADIFADWFGPDHAGAAADGDRSDDHRGLLGGLCPHSRRSGGPGGGAGQRVRVPDGRGRHRLHRGHDTARHHPILAHCAGPAVDRGAADTCHRADD